MQELLNCIAKVAGRYKIEFGEEKSKVMKIGGDPAFKPQFKIGNIDLKYTDVYKYLGEHKNSKNNLDDHIEETRKKTEAAYQTVLSVASDSNFKGIQMQAVWKLYETCIQPIITYGLENWNPTEKELSRLNNLQLVCWISDT